MSSDLLYPTKLIMPHPAISTAAAAAAAGRDPGIKIMLTKRHQPECGLFEI